ncbi:MAG: hypothetical protein PPP56_01985 [Longimonas sp.]|uniref:hypothetical protein n=1 Tax=Longimonas sp. TaxID=2039626 RepID=UPI00335CAE4B
MTDLLLDPRTVLLTHVGTTWTMVGVIWVMQLVHYPLFAYVGSDTYATYQTLHMNRITWIVLPVMALELITAGLLAAGYVPGVSALQAWVGAGLLALIWGSTGLVQAPLHGLLADGFSTRTHTWLVASNWIRTVAWTVRGGLVLWMLMPLLRIP